MKLLIVGMPDSIHVAKWISMLAGTGWDLHFFPAYDKPPNPLLGGVTFHDPSGSVVSRPEKGLLVRQATPLVSVVGRVLKRPERRASILAKLIRRLNPDIVHSHEFQNAGYLTLDAHRQRGDDFPIWIATNWGSDICLFGRMQSHAGRIQQLLSTIDYYACECERDIALGLAHGLRGTALPVTPIGGGHDLDAIELYKAPGPTSARRTIVLKGYQSFAGRALTGLRAIELCGSALAGYRLEFYLSTGEVEQQAEIVCSQNGIERVNVSWLAGTTPHADILHMHGRSRISIGLSISDAISTSFLEAMMLGAFPIQSDSGCANEWIEDGISGSLVPAEDPEPIAAAILRAVNDDDLVDRAARMNEETARSRLSVSVVQPQIVALYERALAGGPDPRVRDRAKLLT